MDVSWPNTMRPAEEGVLSAGSRVVVVVVVVWEPHWCDAYIRNRNRTEHIMILVWVYHFCEFQSFPIILVIN